VRQVLGHRSVDGSVDVEVVGHDQLRPGGLDAGEDCADETGELLGPAPVLRLRALVDDCGTGAGCDGPLGGRDVGAEVVRTGGRASADGADPVTASGEFGDDGRPDRTGGAEDYVQVRHGALLDQL